METYPLWLVEALEQPDAPRCLFSGSRVRAIGGKGERVFFLVGAANAADAAACFREYCRSTGWRCEPGEARPVGSSDRAKRRMVFTREDIRLFDNPEAPDPLFWPTPPRDGAIYFPRRDA